MTAKCETNKEVRDPRIPDFFCYDVGNRSQKEARIHENMDPGLFFYDKNSAAGCNACIGGCCKSICVLIPTAL